MADKEKLRVLLIIVDLARMARFAKKLESIFD